MKPGALLRLAIRLLTLPLYAAFGAWTLIRLPFVIAGRIKPFTVSLGESVRCESCHALNPIHGRWKCHCGATYHGTCLECELCHARASWISCRRCGVSVVLDRRLLP